MTQRTVDMSVVVVTMNNRKYLEPCLESLFGAGLACTYEVLVIDNGSTDGTVDMLAERFADVRVIANDRNVGLSRASNQGIEASNGWSVLLLNDDTIVDGNSLDTLVSFLAAHSDAGAVGGKLLNPDGSFQAGYAPFSTLTQEFVIASGLSNSIGNGYPGNNDSTEAIRVDWICSACLLLRREALQQVGLLDEEYFIYGDEVDIQHRLARQGWAVYYLPMASTVHYGGRSMNRWRRRKMVYRGKLLFYSKNYGASQSITLRAMLSTLSVLKMVAWGGALVVPSMRERASAELASNRDVVKLCLRLE